MTDIITAKEAGDIIGVHASTVINWIKRGELEGKKTPIGWMLQRDTAVAKADSYQRPTPVPTERTRIIVSSKPPAKPGIVSPETITRAKETVIARWSEAMPEAVARRWFGELLEASSP